MTSENIAGHLEQFIVFLLCLVLQLAQVATGKLNKHQLASTYTHLIQHNLKEFLHIIIVIIAISQQEVKTV